MIIVELTWIKNASLENIDKFINTMYRFFFFDEKNLKVKREREVKGNRIWRISWKKWRGRGSMAPIHFFFFFIFSFSREISYMRGRDTLFIFNFSRCDPRSRFFFFSFFAEKERIKKRSFPLTTLGKYHSGVLWSRFKSSFHNSRRPSSSPCEKKSNLTERNF